VAVCGVGDQFVTGLVEVKAMKTVTVSSFSAGVSSAVATKLAISDIDVIIYTHIEDQHPDTLRFVRDCETWFGKPIEILYPEYKSVENACLMASFISGPHGAACSRLLKKRTADQWLMEQFSGVHIRHVWGFDYDEQNRRDRIISALPTQEHLFPLIDRKFRKKNAHQVLKASGIKRPAMYDMGYSNNNCIGCVRGGKGYWNHIRVDFPEVFEARAKLERRIGASCVNGTFLDELNPNVGRHSPPIVEECGMFCEGIALR